MSRSHRGRGSGESKIVAIRSHVRSQIQKRWPRGYLPWPAPCIRNVQSLTWITHSHFCRLVPQFRDNPAPRCRWRRRPSVSHQRNLVEADRDARSAGRPAGRRQNTTSSALGPWRHLQQADTPPPNTPRACPSRQVRAKAAAVLMSPSAPTSSPLVRPAVRPHSPREAGGWG